MRIATKTLTATKLVKEALQKATTFSDYNIFTHICQDYALSRAAAIDQKIANGESVGPLAGVPFAIKDNFLHPVGPTTAASKILANFNSPITSTTVRLLEDAGAILIGRTNLDAFAHGSSTENSFFGPTKNAHNPAFVAGGSSGGSAVAVALDIVQFATGTDTGGSIRQPASFNGVYGFKPTYGATSRYGVVAMASSTDSIGFFAQTATDLDLLMSITAQSDPNDSTTLPTFYHSSPDAQKPKTIGIIKEFTTHKLHPALETAFTTQISALQAAGHQIVELSLPHLQYALAVYYIITPAEVASNLARYDGIRYGFRAPNATTLAEVYANSRATGFMPENKRRIMIGNFVLSSGFFDAYYLQAQKVRTLIIKDYAQAFQHCDFILTPVSPNPAFKFGEKTSDPITMYLEDVMSTPINLAGLPALAFPVAGTTSDHLPLGLQLLAPRKQDAQLLAFAKTLSSTSGEL